MSRQFLIKLLEGGAIPFTKAGTHRRIRLSDVLAYKHERSRERRKHLRAMTALAEECGEYD